MKTKIYLPLIAAGLLATACDDQVMEWRESDPTVKPTEIPLKLAETLARYDYLKNYMAEYHPDVKIFLGMGLDDFLASEEYSRVVLDNYQGVTFGNAMKHGSLMKSNGTLDWTKIDQFLAQNTGLDIYGHNLIWHTQQNQTQLRGLIAPKYVQEQEGGGDGIDNILAGDASNFDGGTTGGWGSWGENMASVEISDNGVDGSKCAALTNKGDDAGNAWKAQFAQSDLILKTGTEYKISFKARSNTAVGKLQFQYQRGSGGCQGGYTTFEVGTDWVTCEAKFTIPEANDGADRIVINFGEVDGTYYVDDIRFGEYTEPEIVVDPMENMLLGAASTFEGESSGWGSWGGNKESAEIVDGAGVDGSKAFVLVNKEDGGSGNGWKAQAAYTFDAPLETGTPYIIQFQAKSNTTVGKLQFQYQRGSDSGCQGGYNSFEVGTDWVTCKYEFTIPEENDGADRILINFGEIAGTYYVDNVKFGKKIDTSAARSIRSRAGAKSYYILKTPEEKKTLLLTAMEKWIKECMEHMGNNVVAWDVINEPIGDDITFRGIDGGWMSNSDDENGVPDSAPVETEEEGLKLNWRSASGNQHFYWGYYLGIDYAVKAFEYARKYSPNGAKLFVNDYNLEVSPAKLAKLIEFVNKIEQGGSTVDGIGTQMHVSMNIEKEKVDAMFQTMAATGKLVRITELDVKIGSKSPSAEQFAQQAECYRMIINSYFENVPAAQQSAITMWTLSDNADEHKYWIPDDAPNLFDSNYNRKHAYKGVCDAIAGFDIGADFESPDYSKN